MQEKITKLTHNNNLLEEENERWKEQRRTSKEKEEDAIKKATHNKKGEYNDGYLSPEGRAKSKEMIHNKEYQRTFIPRDGISSKWNELIKENALLRKQINELIDIVNNNDNAFLIKLADYKNAIELKDNELSDLRQSIKKIVKETEEEVLYLKQKIERLEEKISSASAFSSIIESNYHYKTNEDSKHCLTHLKHLSTENNLGNNRHYNSNDSQQPSRISKLQKSKGNLVLNHHKKILENNERIKQLTSHQIQGNQIKKESNSLDMRNNHLMPNNDNGTKCKMNSISPSQWKINKNDLMVFKHNKTLTPSYFPYNNSDANQKTYHNDPR